MYEGLWVGAVQNLCVFFGGGLGARSISNSSLQSRSGPNASERVLGRIRMLPKGFLAKTFSEAFGTIRFRNDTVAHRSGSGADTPKQKSVPNKTCKLKRGSGTEPFQEHSNPFVFERGLLPIGRAPRPTPQIRNRFRTELENKKGLRPRTLPEAFGSFRL